MDQILESIENIKEKLTSKEYQQIMSSLQTIHENALNQQEYLIEVFYTQLIINKENDFTTIVKPNTRRVAFKQKTLGKTTLEQHKQRENANCVRLNDGFCEDRMCYFEDNYLTKENQATMLNLRNDIIVNSPNDGECGCLSTDPDNGTIMFRVTIIS